MNLRLPSCVVVLFFALSAFAAETKTKVLLITGGHGFQRAEFFKVFDDNKNIAYTHAEHKKDADAFERPDLLDYDAVVLYDMPRSVTDMQKARFQSLFKRGPAWSCCITRCAHIKNGRSMNS